MEKKNDDPKKKKELPASEKILANVVIKSLARKDKPPYFVPNPGLWYCE